MQGIAVTLARSASDNGPPGIMVLFAGLGAMALSIGMWWASRRSDRRDFRSDAVGIEKYRRGIFQVGAVVALVGIVMLVA